MGLTVARYKGMVGYLVHLANSSRVGFQTNGNYYKVLKTDLENGEYILPIPFYNDKEAQIISSNSNGSYFIKVLGVRTGTKYDRIHITGKEIKWFLLDTTNWHYQKRTNAQLRYGLKNLELINYIRTT